MSRRLLSGKGFSHGGGGAATTTWDPANKFQIALSNGNLSATNTSASGNFGTVRSVASHATGQFYVEWHIDAMDGNENGPGFCNATQAIASGAFIGNGVNNVGLNVGNGAIMFNSTTLVSLDITGGSWPAIVGDVIGMAIDIGASKLWMRKNAGNWNASGAANPASGTGSVSTSVTGALFIFADIESNAAGGTLNTGGTAYAVTAPGSFGGF